LSWSAVAASSSAWAPISSTWADISSADAETSSVAAEFSSAMAAMLWTERPTPSADAAICSEAARGLLDRRRDAGHRAR
jgi:hypothetical protein